MVGEFAEGFGSVHASPCAELLERFEVVEMNQESADQYARITSGLRKSSQIIGANDLWIAAAALATEFPLVTNNAKHFSRVPGLKVMGY